jgi:hypothetical protein
MRLTENRHRRGSRRLGTKVMGGSRGEEEEMHENHVEGFIGQ